MFGRAKQAWLEQFLELPNSIPAHDTFGRVFGLLQPEAFEAYFRAWVMTGEVIAFNGKSGRASTSVWIPTSRSSQTMGGKSPSAAASTTKSGR